MKTTITNRNGERIVVLVDEVPDEKGLAFVMHGLSGTKEQPHIVAMAEVCVAAGYTTVRFDTTRTFGESDGNPEDATITSYYADLEDVIAWAKTQSWFAEPFVLAGHSLGGIATALYAETHPAEVKGLAPLSTVVSGTLSAEAKKEQGVLDEWRRTGWIQQESETRPGLVKRLPWSHMEDRMRYNLLTRADRLTMPMLFMVGSEDDTTPPAHQQLLYDAVPTSKKEIHEIEGSGHTFVAPEHIAKVKRRMEAWLVDL